MIDEKKLIEEIKSKRINIAGLRCGKTWTAGFVEMHNQIINEILKIINEQPKVNELIPVEKKLIDEYYELEKNFKILEKNYDELYDMVHYPKTYKLEDIKEEMLVWDDAKKLLIKIAKIVNETIYVEDEIGCLDCYCKFEENRFYPLTKAMERE